MPRASAVAVPRGDGLECLLARLQDFVITVRDLEGKCSSAPPVAMGRYRGRIARRSLRSQEQEPAHGTGLAGKGAGCCGPRRAAQIAKQIAIAGDSGSVKLCRFHAGFRAPGGFPRDGSLTWRSDAPVALPDGRPATPPSRPSPADELRHGGARCRRAGRLRRWRGHVHWNPPPPISPVDLVSTSPISSSILSKSWVCLSQDFLGTLKYRIF
jgi:hypothetical protein